MDLNKFDIDGYVEKRLNKMGIKETNCVKEKDYYNNNKESITKQIRKLLKYFTFDVKPSFFLIEENEGKHILSCFPLEKFEEADVKRFLDHLFDLKKDVNGKIVSQIDKINVDNINDIVEGKYRSYDFVCMGKVGNGNFENRVQLSKQNNRDLIRTNPLAVNCLLEEMGDILELLMGETVYSNLCLGAEYISDLLLQSLIYWVVTPSDISLNEKEKIFTEVKLFISKYKSYVQEQEILKTTAVELEDATAIFTALLKQRNEFGEYLRILDTLEEEQKTESELFGDVDKKYRVEKNGNYPIDAINNIITEGIDVDEYKDKIEKTKEFVKIFRKNGACNAKEDNVMDLKVYFREIYISGSKYKVQAMTIARKYLEEYNRTGNVDSFKKQSEYMFFREKISRGYYREAGLLHLYNKKNILQRQLYDLILTIFLTYDYERSMKLFYSFTFEMIQILFNRIVKLAEQKL